jgi:hypothetical protein
VTQHFHLGQLVRRAGPIEASAHSWVYEIVAILPGEQGVPRYRIKDTDAHMHEVGERNLVAAAPP